MHDAGITLRPLTDADGPALSGLSFSSPDNGQLRYAANYHVDAVQALRAQHGEMEGAAAFAAGRRMVGFGLVRYGKCELRGTLRPFALLGNLIVHPDFRGKGLGARLVAWQVEAARQRLGPDGLLVSNFQRSNPASRRLVAPWLRPIPGELRYIPQAMLAEAPPSPHGLQIGPLDPSEFAAFADGLNEFYAGWNFHQPATSRSLAGLVVQTPLETPFRHPYVVIDARGALQAGLLVVEEYRLKELELHSLPPFLRLANQMFKIVPSEGAVRQVYIDHLWFCPGQHQAARHLIDTVRWVWAGRATNLAALIDPRSPLAALFPSRWKTLATSTTVAVDHPEWVDPAGRIRPIY